MPRAVGSPRGAAAARMGRSRHKLAVGATAVALVAAIGVGVEAGLVPGVGPSHGHLTAGRAPAATRPRAQPAASAEAPPVLVPTTGRQAVSVAGLNRRLAGDARRLPVSARASASPSPSWAIPPRTGHTAPGRDTGLDHEAAHDDAPRWPCWARAIASRPPWCRDSTRGSIVLVGGGDPLLVATDADHSTGGAACTRSRRRSSSSRPRPRLVSPAKGYAGSGSAMTPRSSRALPSTRAGRRRTSPTTSSARSAPSGSTRAALRPGLAQRSADPAAVRRGRFREPARNGGGQGRRSGPA